MPIIIPSSSHTTTAGDIVMGALRLLRVAAPDVTLPADDMANGLQSLNEMVAGWANEGLLIYQVVRESFVTTTGHNPHTWGTGGDFNSTRPSEVLAASLSIGSVDVPMQQISYDAYEAVRLKTLVTYPQSYYIDNAWPVANVFIYPVPNGSTVNFQSYKPLPWFDYPETVVDLPNGYSRALRYNLAVDLAPEWQLSAGEDILRIAAKSVAALKNMNYKPTIAKVDPLLVSIGRGGPRYNPYSDTRG